jgi:pilus assembly protein Flp/PilA
MRTPFLGTLVRSSNSQGRRGGIRYVISRSCVRIVVIRIAVRGGSVEYVAYGLHLQLHTVLTVLLARFEREEGQDLIEYALLAALISVVTIVILRALGVQVVNLFTPIVNTLQGA